MISSEFKNGLGTIKLSGKVTRNSDLLNLKEAYENEKSLFDSLLSHLPDLIYFKNLESKFIRNSKSHAIECGVSSVEDLVDKSDFDFYGEHARKSYKDEQNIIKTKEPIIDVVEKVDSSDSRGIRYMSTTKLPLFDSYGKVIGTLVSPEMSPKQNWPR